MARGITLLARTRSDQAQAIRLLREGMQHVDPDLALINPQTMDAALAQQRWLQRVFATMFGGFAVIALILAAVGVYAITAYAVRQHTRDIGVRMVIGAQSGQVMWLFLKRGLLQLGIGLTVGLAAALAGGRLLQSFLVQTSCSDPLTLVSIVALLTIVALPACVGPTRRATRLNPLDALRHE